MFSGGDSGEILRGTVKGKEFVSRVINHIDRPQLTRGIQGLCGRSREYVSQHKNAAEF